MVGPIHVIIRVPYSHVMGRIHVYICTVVTYICMHQEVSQFGFSQGLRIASENCLKTGYPRMLITGGLLIFQMHMYTDDGIQDYMYRCVYIYV